MGPTNPSTDPKTLSCYLPEVPTHSILIWDQPILSLNLKHHPPGRVATRASTLSTCYLHASIWKSPTRKTGVRSWVLHRYDGHLYHQATKAVYQFLPRCAGMTDHMFERGDRDGFDIASLNIQRGRDHGLPKYNRWREYCGLDPITDLSTMTNATSTNTKLSNAYDG